LWLKKNTLPAKFKMVENVVIKNPKSEARNPKQILNSNVPIIKTTAEFNLIFTTILFGSFEFW